MGSVVFLKRYIPGRSTEYYCMDILTLLLAYVSTWVNTLNYTLGAAVIALAFVYFSRTLSAGFRVLIPVAAGLLVSFLGSGVLVSASVLPQLGYPLCLFALGSGCAAAYLAIISWTKRNLGWVIILVSGHLAAYAVLMLTPYVSFAGSSGFGMFVVTVPVAAVFVGIFTWCSLHWNPRWTPWWVSGDEAGRRAFLQRFRRRKP